MDSRSVAQFKQVRVSTVVLLTLLALSVGAVLTASAPTSFAADDSAAPLMSVAKVRDLSRAEMAKLAEVRIRGSVTFINNNWKVLYVYHDGHSAKVGFSSELEISVGDFVEVKGPVVLGDVGPVIVASDVQVLTDETPNKEPKPTPLIIDNSTRFSASLVDQWVEFEGPAYSAVADDKYHYVSLAGKQFGIYAIIPNSDDLPSLEILREARLRVRGIPSISVQSGAEGQIDFLTPNSSFVEVIHQTDESINPKPRTIGEIGRVDMQGTEEAPARIRAVVRCVCGRRIFISDETGSLMVETHPDFSVNKLTTGDVVEVEGRVVRNQKHEYITDAMIRYVGKGFSLHPVTATPSEAMNRPAELIEISGTLVSDSDGSSSFLMKNDIHSFRVRADGELARKLSKWGAGSRLRLTGCSWVSEGLDVDFAFYADRFAVVSGYPAENPGDEPATSAQEETSKAASTTPGGGQAFADSAPAGRPPFGDRPPFREPPFFLQPPVIISLLIVLLILVGTIIWLLYRRLKTQEKFHESIHEQLSNLSHIARLNTLAEMVGALAHELNQPLTSVSNYAATAELLSKKEPADSDKLTNVLTNIGQEAFRAGEIIRRLRHLVRKKTPGSLPIQISEVINESVELFKSQHVTANGVVEVDVPDNLPAVQADSVQIQQVVLNLLLNARDATEAQSDRPAAIRVGAVFEDGMVSVAVSDNGIGIANPNPEAIFEPYFTTREAGTGLGLAICRTIIETHGGRITADNDVSPHSTRIKFTLPISRSGTHIAS